MRCIQFKRYVKTDDCENCLTMRLADPICFKRGFIWGNCTEEPMWEYTYDVAKDLNIDVSKYFDRESEYNRKCKKVIPPEIRWAIWERDNFTCQNCGSRKFLSIDHIYPESKGGDMKISNLQTLCKSCNSKKSCKIETKG